MTITKTTLQIHKLPGANVVNREITTTHNDMAIIINGETVTPRQLRQYTEPLPNFRDIDDEINAINASDNIKAWLKSRPISDIRHDLGFLPLMIMSAPDPVTTKPKTSSILHMRDSYLSDGTKAELKTHPEHFEATRMANSDKDRPEWLIPMAASFDNMPDDLANCMQFAKNMDAAFIMFSADGPRYHDILSDNNQTVVIEDTD